MELWKKISIFAGILCVLAGIILIGFFPVVNQLIHDDEITYFTATLVDTEQTSVIQHIRKRNSYTTYVQTMTFSPTDGKHSELIIVESETNNSNAYQDRKGTTFTIYNYKDNYAITRDELFMPKGLKAVGGIILILGMCGILIPISTEKRRRY